MNKIIKNILKYLIEVIIVAFGVFLGVYFSNVNTENKIKKEKEKSLNLIIGELDTNRLLLEKFIDYHENIKIEIDSISSNLSEKEKFTSITESEFNHNKIKGWNGFQFARFQKTAFETIKMSGIIKEFDIEIIQKLSKIYSVQDLYIDFGKSILNKAIDTNSKTNTIDLIKIIELMTNDLLGMEKQLKVGFEKISAELKKPLNNV